MTDKALRYFLFSLLAISVWSQISWMAVALEATLQARAPKPAGERQMSKRQGEHAIISAH